MICFNFEYEESGTSQNVWNILYKTVEYLIMTIVVSCLPGIALDGMYKVTPFVSKGYTWKLKHRLPFIWKTVKAGV